MPKSSTEKTYDTRDRYRKFIFVILQYQEAFVNIIAPHLDLETIEEFDKSFTSMHKETMDWIDKNKKQILEKYDQQTGEKKEWALLKKWRQKLEKAAQKTEEPKPTYQSSYVGESITSISQPMTTKKVTKKQTKKKSNKIIDEIPRSVDRSTTMQVEWSDLHLELTKLLLKMSSRDINRPDLNRFDIIFDEQKALIKDKNYWSYLVEKEIVKKSTDNKGRFNGQYETIRENL